LGQFLIRAHGRIRHIRFAGRASDNALRFHKMFVEAGGHLVLSGNTNENWVPGVDLRQEMQVTPFPASGVDSIDARMQNLRTPLESSQTEIIRMQAKFIAAIAALSAVFIISAPVFAHHGGAAYDMSNPITLKGTVTDFLFINPHSLVFFDVKNDKGEIEHWQGELTAPNKLARAGWTKHSLNRGDQVTITGLVGKNNAHAVAIRKLIGPDGQAMQLREE
jgi:hypothetical protein